jgi:hypothetical protein
MLCGSCKNRRFGETWRLLHQGDKTGELGTTQAATRQRTSLLVAGCVVPSSPVFVTLMKEAPGSSETSVLTRATRRNNPEDTIIHSHPVKTSNLTQQFLRLRQTGMSSLIPAWGSQLQFRKSEMPYVML